MQFPYSLTYEGGLFMTHKGNPVVKMVTKYVMLALGALCAAIGLEISLVPNNVIDSGIVGKLLWPGI